MAGKYNPAKRLGVERFARYDKPEWTLVQGTATLVCGCGQVAFSVQKLPMKSQRASMTAKHRRVVAVCINPKCKQVKRLK
jgi:hypothetical protein